MNASWAKILFSFLVSTKIFVLKETNQYSFYFIFFCLPFPSHLFSNTNYEWVSPPGIQGNKYDVTCIFIKKIPL